MHVCENVVNFTLSVILYCLSVGVFYRNVVCLLTICYRTFSDMVWKQKMEYKMEEKRGNFILIELDYR